MNITGNTQQVVVNELKFNSPLTINTLAAYTGLTYNAAQKAVQALRSKKVLVTEGKTETGATFFRLSKRTKVNV